MENRTGSDIVIQERKMQIEKEGWTSEHDAQHIDGELAKAAVCYAMPNKIRKYYQVYSGDGKHSLMWFPWESKWWKPSPRNRIKELAKAGALIIAEIDRLLLLEKQKEVKNGS